MSIYWSEYDSRCQFALRTWIESWIGDLAHHHLLLLPPRFSQAFFFSIIIFIIFCSRGSSSSISARDSLRSVARNPDKRASWALLDQGKTKRRGGEESLFWGGGSALVERWEWRRRALCRRGRLPLRPRLSLWLHPSILPVNVELRTEPFWIASEMTPTPRGVCAKARTSLVVSSLCKIRKP